MRQQDTRTDDNERANQEISRMISDLNEVRMRLDSVVRKLADSQRGDGKDAGSAETVEAVRVALASQLDKIREKLVASIPTQV